MGDSCWWLWRPLKRMQAFMNVWLQTHWPLSPARPSCPSHVSIRRTIGYVEIHHFVRKLWSVTWNKKRWIKRNIPAIFYPEAQVVFLYLFLLRKVFFPSSVFFFKNLFLCTFFFLKIVLSSLQKNSPLKKIPIKIIFLLKKLSSKIIFFSLKNVFFCFSKHKWEKMTCLQ